MTSSDEESPSWAPHHRLPQNPEFYRRVLQHLPTPIVVVNGEGQITYANEAMLTAVGHDLDDVHSDVLLHIHPDDRETMATAFAELVESPRSRLLEGRRWAEVRIRFLNADGTSFLAAVTGTGGMLDSEVGGIIYEVRPALDQERVAQILDGLSRGASMHQLLSLLCKMLASPPLDLEAIALQSEDGGPFLVTASTAPELTTAVRNGETAPWIGSTASTAIYEAVETLPPVISSRLKASGYQDLWHIAADSPLTTTRLRLIVASRTRHVPATGPMDRLARARHLASAILLRSRADALLASSAAVDELTDLPNRAAFYQLAEAVDPLTARALLHVRLDGLSQVRADLGTASADAALQIIADRLRASCGANHTIAHLGHDEFAILVLPQVDGPSLVDDASALAETSAAVIGETIVLSGRSADMSANIGIAVAEAGVATDHLLTQADNAMHDAIQAGRGQIRRFGLPFG